MDDDEIFAHRLAHALEARGLTALPATNLTQARRIISHTAIDYAVLDLRLKNECGIDLLAILREHQPSARAIVLSGYGNNATAVAATKCGAVDFLVKPADIDEIIAALISDRTSPPIIPDTFVLPGEARLGHIMRFLRENDYNVAATARQLGMDRRTLQRILRRNGVPGDPKNALVHELS